MFESVQRIQINAKDVIIELKSINTFAIYSIFLRVVIFNRSYVN